MSFFRSAVAAVLAGLCAAAAQAQTTPAVSTLAAFSISNPNGNLVRGDDGALYGVTSPSTSITGGLVYRVAADGSSITTLFQIPISEAVQPVAGLTLGSDGFFYGTSRFGGAVSTANMGTVFRISQTGTGFTVIHRFAATTGNNAEFNAENPNGAQPESELTEGPDGNLYGVTVAGGQFGTGVVFRLARDGTGFAVLHEFSDDTDTAAASVKNPDGAAPLGQLHVDADGYVYGTTSAGGTNGRGTLFRVRTDGTGFEVLYTFAVTVNDATSGLPENEGGAAPVAGLTDGGDGRLYGVANTGGANGAGAIFAITPTGTFDVLHDFVGADGARPVGELLLGADGRLYGTGLGGGETSTGTASTLGTMFVIDRDGANFTRLHSFAASVGSAPSGRLVQLGAGDFVGTLSGSGQCGYGSVFRYSAAGTTYTGNTSCGRSGNNDSGGGHSGPLLLALLGALGVLRRRIRR